MTPEERKILEEAENQAFETSQALYDTPTTGIRPPPEIEETETTLEGQLFGLDFGGEPRATAEPGASAPPPPTPDVCPDTSLDVTVTISGYTSCGCVEVGGSSAIIDMTNANGTWVLPNYDATNWILFDAFTITVHTYPGVSDCSGAPSDSETDITVQFQCNTDMLIIENTSPLDPPFYFAASGCPIENGATCPYTLGDCDGTTIYGSGGEAVVSW